MEIIFFVCVDHDFALDCGDRHFFLIERYILLGIFERENYAHNILETVFWWLTLSVSWSSFFSLSPSSSVTKPSFG